MKVGAIVVAVLLVLMGGVWIGQGLGYIKGSFMTGDMKWFWIGVTLVVVGFALGALTLTLSRSRGRGELK